MLLIGTSALILIFSGESDLLPIAPLAFQHRRLGMDQSQDMGWTPEDEATLERILNRGEATGRGEEI
ncbi:MAG: hypothetical protein F6K09_26355 [Merismopedia sp. SIO2A8]|nr:hypothetical protein [Merismopedia sp. SIO2A8]